MLWPCTQLFSKGTSFCEIFITKAYQATGIQLWGSPQQKSFEWKIPKGNTQGNIRSSEHLPEDNNENTPGNTWNSKNHTHAVFFKGSVVLKLLVSFLLIFFLSIIFFYCFFLPLANTSLLQRWHLSLPLQVCRFH